MYHSFIYFIYPFLITHFIIHLYSKPKAITLQLVLIVQRLYNFQRSCAIVVSYHGEFIGTVTAIFDYLKAINIEFLIVLFSFQL